MDVQPYLTDIANINIVELLDDWQWLLDGRPCTVFRVTAMGDLIVRDADGRCAAGSR
jgi:hypothetical protein